jgi:hypothetical protein
VDDCEERVVAGWCGIVLPHVLVGGDGPSLNPSRAIEVWGFGRRGILRRNLLRQN